MTWICKSSPPRVLLPPPPSPPPRSSHARKNTSNYTTAALLGAGWTDDSVGSEIFEIHVCRLAVDITIMAILTTEELINEYSI
ncbi:hypothetical protein EVAR_37935_1 [Eumeta japonica]|uniref:Uncharacterized protein n=1 Tax=Eumeta variegata TaxID=151549 RepID=A0A4C1XG22_EUMVA|nr:hypothetical protein EVAR_37935_1 [Eumeta japonica]